MHMSRPLPAYASHTSLGELNTAELFVVQSFRLWVLPHCEPGRDHPDWRAGFDSAGIDEEGARAFDTLLRVVAVAASREVEVRCPQCRTLASDEGALLHIVALMQRARIGEAASLLSDWLPATAVRMAIPAAHLFAQALEARGLSMPYRTGLVDTAAMMPATCCSDMVH